MKKRGQIWVETVIYTLIGLSIIAIVLAMVKPAIDDRRDAITIKQSIESLNVIDQQIESIKYLSEGNTRPIDIKISKGKMIVSGENDSITIIIDDSKHEYSQPGAMINVGGNVRALTEKKGGKFTVSLFLSYQNSLNITYQGKDESHVFQVAPSPYRISIRNNGVVGTLTNIDFF